MIINSLPLMTSAMADTSTSQFCLVGRFLTFVPGKKSPYQKLSLAVVPHEASAEDPTHEPVIYQIRLGKDLRKMMYRYLQPQDWVRVVGKQVIDKRDAQLKWKATEIVKLSAAQVQQMKDAVSSAPLSKTSLSSKTKTPRVLICQKSSCRKRGSGAVSRAMEAAMDQCDRKATIQATGCMKHCKSGPHVVMLSGKKSHQEKYSHVTPEQGRSLIRSMLGVVL
jgi:NADH:ubiquinone oxidoreductase subunit E